MRIMNQETMTERRVLATLAEGDVDRETIDDRLARLFGSYWSVDYSVCDRSLAHLTADGLVAVTWENDRTFGADYTTAKRPREKYALTDAGKERLRSLAREPLRPATDIF